MARPENPNKPDYKTMQVTKSNHRKLTRLKPHDIPMRDWFNEQIAALIEFKENSERLSER